MKSCVWPHDDPVWTLRHDGHVWSPGVCCAVRTENHFGKQRRCNTSLSLWVRLSKKRAVLRSLNKTGAMFTKKDRCNCIWSARRLMRFWSVVTKQNMRRQIPGEHTNPNNTYRFQYMPGLCYGLWYVWKLGGHFPLTKIFTHVPTLAWNKLHDLKVDLLVVVFSFFLINDFTSSVTHSGMGPDFFR